MRTFDASRSSAPLRVFPSSVTPETVEVLPDSEVEQQGCLAQKRVLRRVFVASAPVDAQVANAMAICIRRALRQPYGRVSTLEGRFGPGVVVEAYYELTGIEGMPVVVERVCTLVARIGSLRLQGSVPHIDGSSLESLLTSLAIRCDLPVDSRAIRASVGEFVGAVAA